VSRCGLCQERREATHVVVTYRGSVRVARAPLTACRDCALGIVLENAQTETLLRAAGALGRGGAVDAACAADKWRAEPLS